MPSLDGLRAVSIALVIGFHAMGAAAFHGKLIPLGNLGVRVFFVISGFLITGLLLRELEKTGNISLKKFYARRALRIFPAFYLFLAVVAVCAAAGVVQVHKGDLLGAASYTINYFRSQPARCVRHIWSLSVEEQFYPLWPAVLMFVGRRRGLIIACGMIVLAPFLRMNYWLFLPDIRDMIDRRFETVADALATGCVLAGIQAWLASKVSYNRFLQSRSFYIVPAIILLDSIFLSSRPRLTYGIGLSILNTAIALCIDRWVRYPGGVVGNILNSPAVRAIGVLSYSLYLWQQPFLDTGESPRRTSLLFKLLAAVCCSVASFYLIERPFQRLRARFHQQQPMQSSALS